jgi:hypothetical protein
MADLICPFCGEILEVVEDRGHVLLSCWCGAEVDVWLRDGEIVETDWAAAGADDA